MSFSLPLDPRQTGLMVVLKRLARRLDNVSLGYSQDAAAQLCSVMRELKRCTPGLERPPNQRNIDLEVEQVRHRMSQSQSQIGLAIALEALARWPHAPQLWNIVGDACFDLNDLAAATNAKEHACWLHPGYASAWDDYDVLCGWIKEANDATELMKEWAHHVHASADGRGAKPASGQPTIYDLTGALLELAHREQGLAEGEELSAYAQHRLRFIMGQLERFLPGVDEPPNRDAAVRRLQRAEQKLRQGCPEKALMLALQGLANSPHEPVLWYLVASIAFELRSVETAMRALCHTLWLHPGYHMARADLETLTSHFDTREEGGE